MGFGTTNHTYPEDNNHVIVPYNSPEPFAIYGLQNCSGLPGYLPELRQQGQGVGVSNPLWSACPSERNLGWVRLAGVSVEGLEGSWVKDSMVFSPSTDIQAIAIGPDCVINPSGQGKPLVYYLNGLQFYQSSVPKVSVDITGNSSLCDNAGASATLQMRSAGFYKGSQLRWYKNNVALNETDSVLTVPKQNTAKAGTSAAFRTIRSAPAPIRCRCNGSRKQICSLLILQTPPPVTAIRFC